MTPVPPQRLCCLLVCQSTIIWTREAIYYTIWKKRLINGNRKERKKAESKYEKSKEMLILGKLNDVSNNRLYTSTRIFDAKHLHSIITSPSQVSPIVSASGCPAFVPSARFKLHTSSTLTQLFVMTLCTLAEWKEQKSKSKNAVGRTSSPKAKAT